MTEQGTSSSDTSRGAVSDSPLFWIFLFSAMGMMALWASVPKYTWRQTQIEQQYHGATEMQRREAGLPATEIEVTPDERPMLITLRPLFIVTAGIAIVAAGALALQYRPRKIQPNSTPSNGGAP